MSEFGLRLCLRDRCENGKEMCFGRGLERVVWSFYVVIGNF